MARTRVVKTRDEFEGEYYESLAIVEGRDLAGWAADRDLTHVGRPVPRVDAIPRVTGRARYTHDIQLPGMLHARILRSPYAHARVRKVDARKALALPGVRAVLHRFNAPKTPYRGEDVIFRDEVRFVGDDVAAVCAVDVATAAAALALIDVEYEVLPFVVDLEEAMRDEANVEESSKYERGDAKRAMKAADFTVEAEYRTATQLHNSMETHGAVVHWDGDQLMVWESTQHVFGVRNMLKQALDLPFAKIRVVCDYMGGGFGSKGGAGKYTVVAALLSRQIGAPVRCVFTREEENLAAGNRSATFQRVSVALSNSAISAIEHRAWSGAGGAKWIANATGPTTTLYDVPNVSARSYRVNSNAGNLSAFRAPGYVEGTFALESAIDEVAFRAGLDPLALRRRHARSSVDPNTKTRYSLKRLLECYEVGAREIGWSKRRAAGTRGSAPHLRRGLGMASQIWGGGGSPPAYATVHVNPDGTAIVRAGTQDIGTGTRTILAQLVAEEVGLDVDAVRVVIGDTESPYGPISAGSTTVASVGPAVRIASVDAREQLLAAAAGVLEVQQTELRIERGAVVSKGGRVQLKDVLVKMDNHTVIGRGSRHPNPELSIKTFGAQFAEVEVDTRTGHVAVEHVVAVHDIGRVVNPMLAASQVEGGILQGIGFALYEERVFDLPTGRVVNANLEGYKVPTVRDVPKITVRFPNKPDRANNIGAKGLGEPPIIPTAAAIANAIANATGARVRTTPMTPARVLAALEEVPRR